MPPKLFPILIVIVLLAASCRSGPSMVEESPESGLYHIKVWVNENSLIRRSDETKIGNIIKNKFGIVFDYMNAPGNYENQLNMMLAEGSYPEIVTIQDNMTFDKYVRAGALLPLDDFVKAAPDFAEIYKRQIPLWRLSAYDGKLYKWEGRVPTDFETVVEVNDVGVRIDALEQQGWPNLLSTDDYIRFLKQALADNPVTNGRQTIGMVVPFAEPWGMQGISAIMYEKGGTYSMAAGNLGVVWNQKESRFEDMMTNEYVKEGLHFFNKLFREGLLDKESFTDTMAQVQEKLNDGRAISAWYVTWGLLPANQNLIGTGHPERQYINMPIRSPTQLERNEKRQIRLEDTRPFAIFAITNNAKYPDRIKELLAWSKSEEGQLLLQSGVQGEEYDIVDGRRMMTQAYRQALSDMNAAHRIGFGMFSFLGLPLMKSPDGAPYSLQYDPKIREDLQLTPQMREAYKQLGWANSKDYFLQTGEAAHTGVAGTISIDTTSRLGMLHQKLIDFRVEHSAKLIILPESDEQFERMYASFIGEYQKMAPEQVVDEYNRLYREAQARLK